MRILYALIILPFLAACSAQQICVSRETEDLKKVQAFIAETEANLERGYAIVETQHVEDNWPRCGRFYCGGLDVDTVETAQAIDITAEKAKLAALKKQEAELSAKAAAAIEACKLQYPE